MGMISARYVKAPLVKCYFTLFLAKCRKFTGGSPEEKINKDISEEIKSGTPSMIHLIFLAEL